MWGFSESKREKESLVSFPPRLGGKTKRGVFATRSPYRPNSIGMSVVKIEKLITDDADGILKILVTGADMLDGTPIYDIKPYMAYSDSIPEAIGGTGHGRIHHEIQVIFPQELRDVLPDDIAYVVVSLLKQDPRDAYNRSADYIYAMEYAGYDIRFTCSPEPASDAAVTVTFTVVSVVRTDDGEFVKVKSR